MNDISRVISASAIRKVVCPEDDDTKKEEEPLKCPSGGQLNKLVAHIVDVSRLLHLLLPLLCITISNVVRSNNKHSLLSLPPSLPLSAQWRQICSRPIASGAGDTQADAKAREPELTQLVRAGAAYRRDRRHRRRRRRPMIDLNQLLPLSSMRQP